MRKRCLLPRYLENCLVRACPHRCTYFFFLCACVFLQLNPHSCGLLLPDQCCLLYLCFFSFFLLFFSFTGALSGTFSLLRSLKANKLVSFFFLFHLSVLSLFLTFFLILLKLSGICVFLYCPILSSPFIFFFSSYHSLEVFFFCSSLCASRRLNEHIFLFLHGFSLLVCLSSYLFVYWFALTNFCVSVSFFFVLSFCCTLILVRSSISVLYLPLPLRV